MEICLILDFGSQYTQLIARKLRELGVKSVVAPPTLSTQEISELKPLGIILSGGPASVGDLHSPKPRFELDRIRVPVLGICYGMQWLIHEAGGRVVSGKSREYGVDEIIFTEKSRLFPSSLDPQEGSDPKNLKGSLGSPNRIKVLMSHGDHAESVPESYRVVAKSRGGLIAAVEHNERQIYGLQFHPEVHHTENGSEILRRFLVGCRFRFDWKPASIFEEIEDQLKLQVGEQGRILCALSGGVDSAVVALILHKLYPDRVDSLCVDTGLLRKNEMLQLQKLFSEKLHFPIQIVDASEVFIRSLANVTDPEEKRKIIGKVFIDVFEAESRKLKEVKFLAQGTLYPDIIESRSHHGGPSAKIKSHHNVGGLPERLPFVLVEPLKELFKDEVRRLGEFLGLPHEFVWRHPFPGPGLAVRILGGVTSERLHCLREADAVLQEILEDSRWSEKLWQGFCVLLPVQSVGVMGDQRTYENAIAVRAVHSEDGMTAHIAGFAPELLERISSQIINRVQGINRVVYDISSKPPATIEWE